MPRVREHFRVVPGAALGSTPQVAYSSHSGRNVTDGSYVSEHWTMARFSSRRSRWVAIQHGNCRGCPNSGAAKAHAQENVFARIPSLGEVAKRLRADELEQAKSTVAVSIK